MRRRFMLWLVLSGITAVIGAGYSLAAGGTPAIGATVGLVLGGSLMALELFVLQRRPGEALRQLPLPIYILISTFLWVVIISICVELVPALMELDEPDDEPDDDPTAFGQDLAFALLVSLVLNTGLRIGALVGPRFLFNFLVGRYHRPLHEDRVFMFLDLADSTQLAEELGDLRAQSLIRQFFFDIASPIAAHGGETHRYIGDEVVVTWPLERDATTAPWVECVLDIRTLMATRRAWYSARFGAVPRFRVGLHGGTVVASEVGDQKREIVYFGDTVNTAARLCAACKELGKDVLISAELMGHADVPTGAQSEPLAPLALRGKNQPIDVLALSER